MAFRNIVLESDAHLTLKQDQLIIRTERGTASVAIEDVNALLIESRQTVISTAVLSRLAQFGVAVFICDERHLPCSILIPYSQHSRQLQAIENQLNLTLSAKKRLWQQIVTEKVNNQGRCLLIQGKKAYAERLFVLAKAVRTGDEKHIESYAAAQYFTSLFGSEFTRSDACDMRNAALNYGYAIIRGCVARTLTTYGFITAIGLNHHSELNPFNLADDFIEPFRPVVDLLVAEIVGCESEHEILSKSMKRSIINLLNCDMHVEGRRYSVTYAIELCVQSFVAACAGRTKILKLPELIPLAQHKYE
ncbi:MAG: type II CRISPR-associated endonuclease Cas1 [Oscillospiraceae bacterium]|jgi:CRISPR-associated protein Cas1